MTVSSISRGEQHMKVLMHLILTFVTGGLWLIFLLVRYLVKNK